MPLPITLTARKRSGRGNAVQARDKARTSVDVSPLREIGSPGWSIPLARLAHLMRELPKSARRIMVQRRHPIRRSIVR